MSRLTTLRRWFEMVSSRVYPGLERKPGGPDNWVEAAGGLPSYVERIAKHLHYERGMSIQHAIATAVNTIKRWARGGHVTKYGTMKRVSPATIAKAAAAVAQWEAKKKAGAMALTEELFAVIDLTEVSNEFAFDLLDLGERIAMGLADPGTGANVGRHAILSAGDIDLSRGGVNIQALARRANEVEDPSQRADARQAVLDLASTIAPRNARGKAKDGRNSFKKQGKWKHGFIPVNTAAHEAKAKGSPIAMKRTRRLFGKGSAPDDTRKSSRENTKAAVGTAGQRSAGGRKTDAKDVVIDEKSTAGSERVKDVAFIRHTGTKDATSNRKAKGLEATTQKEASKETRIPERARQNWDEIPETLKTVRGGKRYVVAEFGGKQYVTEWVGGIREGETKNTSVTTSVGSQDAKRLGPARLRALLNDPRTPASAKAQIRKSLKGVKS